MSRKADLTAVISAVDKVSPTLKRIQRKMRQPIRAVTGFGKAVGGLGAKITGMLGPIGALGGALSVAGLTKTVTDFASAADEASKFARQLGLSTEAYTELTYAADRQGVSQATFNSSMGAFTKRLGELKAGTGGLYTLLTKVNPELAEQLKTAESSEQAFTLMMDAINRVEGAQQKNALAAAAFSRSGMAMTRMAEAGADGLNDLRAQARRLGLSISDEMGKKAESFVDSMTNVQGAMSGLSMMIGAELMPHVQPLIDQFTEWTIANRELIGTKIGAFIKDITQAIMGYDKQINAFGDTEHVEGLIDRLPDLMAKVESLGETIGSVVDAIGGWENAAIGIIAMMNGPLIMAIATVISTFAKLSTVLLANPIGLAVAGIALAAYMIYRHWDGVAAWFERLWGNIQQVFEGFVNFLKAIFTGDMEGAVQAAKQVWSGLTGYYQTIVDGTLGVFKTLLTDLLGLFGVDFDEVTDKAKEAMAPMVDGATEIVNDLKAEFQGVLDWIENVWSKSIGKAVEGVSGVAGWFAEKLGLSDDEPEAAPASGPRPLSAEERMAMLNSGGRQSVSGELLLKVSGLPKGSTLEASSEGPIGLNPADNGTHPRAMSGL